MDCLNIVDIARHWDISCRGLRDDIVIPGSPERCLERFVVEDGEGRLFVLESIPSQAIPLKTRIACTLQWLSDKGLADIHPYLPGNKGNVILETDTGNWQIAPFVTGVDLDRPAYVGDGWRGAAMADFLVSLRQTSQDIPYYRGEIPFSITTYIRDMTSTLERHEPSLRDTLAPILSFLDERFTVRHDRLPLAFCHGDLHPLNIVWGRDNIRAVIDWEFAGYKPEIYDAALLVGCVGMEDPEGLLGEFVLQFLHSLRTKEFFSPPSWDILLEFVVAIRFAWLAEWLRKCDSEMVDLETIYLKLLVNYADYLREAWQV